MIYLDSSVVLARLFAEDLSPRDAFWDLPQTSSWLLQYEVWNRIHVRRLADFLGRDAEMLLDHVELIELAPDVLRRALQRFPVPVRTLDSLHLATVDYLRRQGQEVQLASYDQRLLAAANALGIEAAPL